MEVSEAGFGQAESAFGLLVGGGFGGVFELEEGVAGVDELAAVDVKELEGSGEGGGDVDEIGFEVALVGGGGFRGATGREEEGEEGEGEGGGRRAKEKGIRMRRGEREEVHGTSRARGPL